MSAAGRLELDFNGVTLNNSVVSDFDYDDVNFEEGLGHVSSAWSSAVEARDLREVCIRVEPDWIKVAGGSLTLTFLIDFQKGIPFELEAQFFGGSSWDKSYPGESSFWYLAEEELSLGPAGWSKAASLLPFEEEPVEQEEGEEDDDDEAFPPYPDIYPAVVARFFAERLGVTRLTGMRYAGRCKEVPAWSLCKPGDFRFTTA